MQPAEPLQEPPRSPEQPAGARGPPRRQNFTSPHQNKAKTAVQNRSIRTLAGRAQARYRRGSVQCTNSRASDVLLRHFRSTPAHCPAMHIALFQPDIAQNTGTILRLCACLGLSAHIIEPAGFPFSDRLFRRAGMDYLNHVSVTRHDSWPKFEQWRAAQGCRLLLFTTKGAT